MMKLLLVVAIALAVTSCLAIKPPSNQFRKKLQGPPSEFAQHRIPKPEESALNSQSSWHEITFTKAEDGTFVWKGEVRIFLPKSLFSLSEAIYFIFLFAPRGVDLDLFTNGHISVDLHATCDRVSTWPFLLI
jgi:hypothetical protein